jgi:hypothetical protein
MGPSFTAWKQFPDSQRGGVVEAPIGPGVYEVRLIANSEPVAFGYSKRVAQDLSRLRPNTTAPSWMRRLMRDAEGLTPSELEYRTCAAATLDEAKSIARGMLGRRQIQFMRRAHLAWA